MPSIRPISAAEYASWLSEAVPAYAADKVRAGTWPAESALEMSRVEHETLLPQGKDTPGHYLYAIVAASGEQVGTIWFAAQDRGASRVAYVYGVEVRPEYRRLGYAQRAFEAIEEEVGRLGLAGIALHVFGHNTAAQSLYTRLGYMPTNIHMYKPLGGTEPGRSH
jgi:ribosomal protein S18 acetylase RimI-like enzyme